MTSPKPSESRELTGLNSRIIASASQDMADVLEQEIYKRSVWQRVTFVLQRTLWLALIIYGANALFNVGDVIANGGVDALSRRDVLSHALLLTEFTALAGQLPALILPILGAIALALVLLIWATLLRVRRLVFLRNSEALLQGFEAYENSKADVLIRYQQAKEANDPTTSSTSSVEEILRQAEEGYAKRERSLAEKIAKWDTESRERMERLAQIAVWLEEDDKLASLSAYLIRKRRWRRDLMLSVVAPAAAVIGARLLVVAHMR